MWLSFQAGSCRLGNCLASSVRRAICAAWSRPPAPLRSNINVVIATFQPSFSGPTRFSLGTATSAKNTALKWRWPLSSTSGRTVIPGVFMSTSRVADAVMLRRAGVGADQQEAPVREMRARGPYFLSVDDKIVVAVDGARAQTGEIPARIGFGIALAPQLVGAQNPRQVALFLFLGAPMDQGRAQ